MRSEIRPARVKRLLARTLDCRTAPFREGEVIAWVREFAASRTHLALNEDADGNLALSRRGVRASPRPLVLAAHMDHPGFRALRSKRTRAGWRIEALFLGGVRPEFFAGARARFHPCDAREVTARVERSARDPRSGERRVSLSARAPVPRGAFGTWDLPGFRLSRRDPDLVETRAADDLAGVAGILALLERIDAIDPRRRVDVRALFTRAEEVGFVGALSVARGRRLPRGARIVAIEASKALPDAPQGAGPILRVGDRTSIFDDALSRWLGRVAAGLAAGGRFRFQRKLMDGGTCESTAYQLFGYRCAGLCLPLGNYHNMSERGRIAPETIRLSDLVGLVRFFEGLVRADGDAPRPGRTDPLRARLDRSLGRGRAGLARDPFAG
jgi:putative aminopeptidase FrvX